MPPMCTGTRTSEVLYTSELLHLRNVCCHEARGANAPEEEETWPTLVIPLRGAFLWHVASREALLDSNTIALFSRLATYRVSHPFEGGDRCLALAFSREVLGDAFGTDEISPKYWIFPVEWRTQIHRMLAGICDPKSVLRIEESAVELLSLLASIRPQKTARSERDVVRNLREVMNARIEMHDTLAQLADLVAYSPFHAARVFRAETGITLHQYRHAIRLMQGLEQLRFGNDAIAQIAVALGFHDQSHFSASFCRAFGVAPSSLRCKKSRRSC